jgi:hypothetical protein
MYFEASQKTVDQLSCKRESLAERGTTLADERNGIAYAAHVEGDAKARKWLDVINLEITTLAGEQASVEAAIEAANARLAPAQAEVRPLIANKQSLCARI